MRRFARFSLGTMLLAVILAAAVLSAWRIVVLPVRERVAVSAVLATSGASIERRVVPRGWGDWLLGISDPAEIVAIRFDPPGQEIATFQLTEAASIKAAPMPQPIPIPDEVWEALLKCRSLERLGLVYADIGDAEVARLAALPNLIDLDLRATRVTEASIRPLAAARRLERLDLTGTFVRESVAPTLAAMPRLESLSLPTTFRQDGIEVLGRSQSLRHLDLPDYLTSDVPAALAEAPLKSIGQIQHDRASWFRWIEFDGLPRDQDARRLLLTDGFRPDQRKPKAFWTTDELAFLARFKAKSMRISARYDELPPETLTRWTELEDVSVSLPGLGVEADPENLFRALAMLPNLRRLSIQSNVVPIDFSALYQSPSLERVRLYCMTGWSLAGAKDRTWNEGRIEFKVTSKRIPARHAASIGEALDEHARDVGQHGSGPCHLIGPMTEAAAERVASSGIASFDWTIPTGEPAALANLLTSSSLTDLTVRTDGVFPQGTWTTLAWPDHTELLVVDGHLDDEDVLAILRSGPKRVALIDPTWHPERVRDLIVRAGFDVPEAIESDPALRETEEGLSGVLRSHKAILTQPGVGLGEGRRVWFLRTDGGTLDPTPTINPNLADDSIAAVTLAVDQSLDPARQTATAAMIERLTGLTDVTLVGGRPAPALVAAIGRRDSLTSLIWEPGRTPIRVADPSGLLDVTERLPRLTRLVVHSHHVSPPLQPTSAARVARCRTLEDLQILNGFPRSELPGLAGLTNLTALGLWAIVPDRPSEANLAGDGVWPSEQVATRAELAGLTASSGLELLAIPDLPLDTAGIEVICGCAGLTELWIDGAALTPADVRTLLARLRLTTLVISHAAFSPAVRHELADLADAGQTKLVWSRNQFRHYATGGRKGVQLFSDYAGYESRPF